MSTRPFPLWRPRPGVATALLCLILLAVIVGGYEGHRVAQICVLALPALLWLRVPLASARWRTARLVMVTTWVAAFLVDGAARIYLLAQYQAAPDSSLVVAAMANTNWREATEYASANVPLLVMLGAGLAATLVLAGWMVRLSANHARPLQRPEKWLMGLLLLLCVIGLMTKPWRRHHPLLFWPQWAGAVQELRLSWTDQWQQRQDLLASARAAGARTSTEAPSTVVLVLTDSVNRDNMSLYGYPRETTPQLAALRWSEHGRLMPLRYAWSVQPGTVASLSGLFSFGEREVHEPVDGTQHILALARAAGYRVWWMSNHDDLAIEQQHAQLADSVEMVNRAPGRSTAGLDGELLDCLEEALVDPAPRKLIVVHLLGAHPHYRLRAPESFDPFPEEADRVDEDMMRAGQPAWVRTARRAYDRAISYHDSVVAQTLRLSRQHAPADGSAAWMFVSDHGQEVGHQVAHAGHSPSTPAGYRIPALIWRSEAPFDETISTRPFRVDWASWTLASLMHIEWNGMDPRRDVLNPAYAWEAPRLPAKVARFDQ